MYICKDYATLEISRYCDTAKNESAPDNPAEYFWNILKQGFQDSIPKTQNQEISFPPY